MSSRKTHGDTLPDALVWREDGHLDDVAITCLADYEEAALPKDAVEHSTECEVCARRIGDAALLSMDIASSLHVADVASVVSRERSRSGAPSSRGSRLPVFAIAAAFLVAALGALPRLLELPSVVDSVSWFLRDGLGTVWDTIWGVVVGAHMQRVVIAAAVASTILVFAAMAVLVVRSRSLLKKAEVA